MKVAFLIVAILALVNAEKYVSELKIENVLASSLRRLIRGSEHKYQVVQKTSIARNAVDDKIIEFLEKAREQFDVGFPDAGIPPLDPFTLDNVTFHLELQPIYEIDILLLDLRVVGLKEFIIKNINFKIVGLSLEFEFVVPEIVFTTHFGITANILDIITIHPDGELRLALTDFNISGKAVLGTAPEGNLLLRSFDIDFDTEGISITLEEIFGFQKLNEVVNFALSHLSDDFFEGQREGLRTLASTELFDIINELLKDINLGDIIG